MCICYTLSSIFFCNTKTSLRNAFEVDVLTASTPHFCFSENVLVNFDHKGYCTHEILGLPFLRWLSTVHDYDVHSQIISKLNGKGKKKTKHRNTSRDATVQLQINYRHSFRFWKLTSAAFLVLMFPATDIFTEVGERNKTGKVVNCLSLLQVLGIVFSFSQSKTQVSLHLFPWI